jgi:hypothetical protein
MANLYSLTASTTARKEAEAWAARKAYEKRKTRAAQVAVFLEDAAQASTNATAAAPHKMASATSQRQTAETATGVRGSGQGASPFGGSSGGGFGGGSGGCSSIGSVGGFRAGGHGHGGGGGAHLSGGGGGENVCFCAAQP